MVPFPYQSMKIFNRRTLAAFLWGAGINATPEAIAAELIELYVDKKTQQIFASPGAGRDRIGTFAQVDSAAPPPDVPVLSAKPPVAASEPSGTQSAQNPTPWETVESKKWYDRLSLRGYTQLRYNHGLGDGAYGLKTPGDRFVGNNTGFGIRRARVVLSGDLNDHVAFYLQQDFASIPTGSGTWNFGQLRDAYTDIFFDTDHEYRIRAGQSKVPYGWENLQSSQNRIAPDRADALNSGVRDERDIGVFFYYTPKEIEGRFRDLIKSGLKGSGDYGVFGVGVYNGQGANRPERNSRVHTVVHLTYPFKLPNGQYLEIGADAYTGRFQVSPASITTGGRTFTPTDQSSRDGANDQRAAVHAIYYPQPFGLQAEWTVGRSPQLDLSKGVISTKPLQGGYVQAMYKVDHPAFGTLIPYAKWQTFRGASKFDNNAPAMRVNEIEIGAEWQPFPALELTAAYSRMKRTNLADAPYEPVKGNMFRVQLQTNY
jgi:hypothetical protein